MYSIYNLHQEIFTVEAVEARVHGFLDSDYSRLNIEKLVETYEYLTLAQRALLCEMLYTHPQLFHGGLGICNMRPVELEIIEGANPYHAKPYLVPKAHKEQVNVYTIS